MGDQAGRHKSTSLKVPENIILKSLAPYSPELNPVEKLGPGLKNASVGTAFWHTCMTQ
jgi:transposase